MRSGAAQVPEEIAVSRPSAARTDDVMARFGPVEPGARASASSSGVTSQGPIDDAKSLALAGPIRTGISSRWRSRADQSLRTKKPPMAASARSAERSTAGVSTSAPTSSSKSSSVEPDGAQTGSSGPRISEVFEK
jgi:hypothetical protein